MTMEYLGEEPFCTYEPQIIKREALDVKTQTEGEEYFKRSIDEC